MKCPKCGYLGFEPVDRCRNCGYDFSLAEIEPLELPLRPQQSTLDPLADLEMVDAAIPERPTPSRLGPTPELPLFGLRPDEESDLDQQPRRNVVLRRPAIAATVAAQRPRRHEAGRDQMLDLEPDVPVTRPAWASHHEEREAPDDAPDAGLTSRLFAVAFDLAILAAIDAVVVYFTLAICGMTLAEFDLLPKGPLLGFLFVQNAGYLVAFTAGGQTLGKMLAGIRVVSDNSDIGLDLGRAALRTAVWVLLAVPAGLGFLTAIFSSDHRGLHDRFAQTRVVRG